MVQGYRAVVSLTLAVDEIAFNEEVDNIGHVNTLIFDTKLMEFIKCTLITLESVGRDVFQLSIINKIFNRKFDQQKNHFLPESYLRKQVVTAQ